MSTKPTPPSVTKSVTDFSALLQDPEITQIATPTPASEPSVEANDPTIRLSISVTKSFAAQLRQLADETQGARPRHGNLSLLLRASVIEVHRDWFKRTTD